MLENANPLEIGWTVTGCITFLVLIVALVFFTGRMLIAFKKENEVDLQTRLLCVYKFAGVVTGLCIQLSFILAGVIAMGNPDDANEDAGLIGLIIVILIILSELALSGLAIFDFFLIRNSLKHETLTMLDEEKRKVIWSEQEREQKRP